MLENLNENQKIAVEHKDGPLLIFAGAGSGKTKVLTNRVAYLINNYGVSPYNILAITFTNKAAGEMKTRLNLLIGDLSKNVMTSTFHSFGLKILRENYSYLGYLQNFNIMDSEDSLTIIKRCLKEQNLDPKMYNPYAIRSKISSNKNELVMPSEYKKFVRSDFDEVVATIYEKYQNTLYKNNSVDFDDLLILPIKLFREHDDILEKYQERFKYILIDEYQDTNEAQYVLTKMISSKYRNICVVGDNDQAIYGFRNANYRNILNFEKDFKDCTVIMLEENYRSTKNILKAANSVIKNNTERKDKNLWSNKEDGEKLTYYRAENEADEAAYIIREVKKLLIKGVKYEDIVVLYRTNAQSQIIERSFVGENIPYKVVGSMQFYGRKEIKDLMAYLKLIYNSNDDISLQRIINTPKRGIGTKTIENLISIRDELNISMYDAITSGKELEFKNLIEDLKEKSVNVTLTELVDIILEKSGMKKELESEHTLEADIRLENLEEFKSITKEFENRVGEISLEEFLLETALLSDANEYKNDNNRVNLMTVHAVKGLEFDYVFIVGLEEGIFPHINSMMDKSELEEERRLCYVALTRAKMKVYLINARMRMLYGRDQVNVPSRFINEIDQDLIESDNIKDKPVKKIEKMTYDDDVSFNLGDKVMHDKYGKGIVVGIEDKLISVAFSKEFGIKKLLKNHKSIKKI